MRCEAGVWGTTNNVNVRYCDVVLGWPITIGNPCPQPAPANSERGARGSPAGDVRGKTEPDYWLNKQNIRLQKWQKHTNFVVDKLMLRLVKTRSRWLALRSCARSPNKSSPFPFNVKFPVWGQREREELKGARMVVVMLAAEEPFASTPRRGYFNLSILLSLYQ